MITLSDYFLELWRTANGWSHMDRSEAFTADKNLNTELKHILWQDDELKVVDDLKHISQERSSTDALKISFVLTCMKCIDEIFSHIHPRFLSQAGHTILKKPMWLNQYQIHRLEKGYFAKDQKSYLIARGPLLRSNRSENAFNAESLADRFSALSVTNRQFEKDANFINIEINVISTEAVHGVPLGNRAGKEHIVCVAIAEDSDDICTNSCQRGDSGFISYEISPDVNSAQRMFEAIRQTDKLDIAVAPELVMPHADAEKLASMLSSSSMDCRMIIAGSGNSPSEDGKPPWNESNILNASGMCLWKQRKIWPANISAEQAKQMGFCDDPTAALYYEDNSDDKTLIIADIDSLGRCLVLICQDLKETIISELIRQYQPDWVFVPILDHGIDPGRWHQRTIQPLSELSQARFLVSSCMTLARRKCPDDPPNIGMLHGPFLPEAGEIERGIAFVKSQSSDSPHFVAFRWDEIKWQLSSSGAK